MRDKDRWKKKSPDNRKLFPSEQKERANLIQGNKERAQMEIQANAPFRLSLFDMWSLKAHIKEASSFSVVLRKTLPISEIYERMQRAFGDLADDST